MITVNIDVRRSMAASQWFAENGFALTDPQHGVAKGQAIVGPMISHKRGIDIPYRFHPDDHTAAMLFKLTWA